MVNAIYDVAQFLRLFYNYFIGINWLLSLNIQFHLYRFIIMFFWILFLVERYIKI